jgi:SAM-dependent methyltransferase
MPSPAVVRHFDDVAAGYGAFRNAWPLSVIRRQERAALCVLDAGCGDGELLAWLETTQACAIGIDISRAMTAQCRQRGYRVSVQDLERPALQAVFDWVVCFGALEFAAEPAQSLAALASLLQPGGRFVLLFPRQNPLGRLYAAYHRIAHGVRIHLFRKSEIAGWMRRAHLDEPAWRDLSLSTLCVAASSPTMPGQGGAGGSQDPHLQGER